MKKFILSAFAASVLCSATVRAEDIKQPYVAICVDGKIAAQAKGAKGPVRTLWLLTRGTQTVPCEKGAQPPKLDQLSEPYMGTSGEGLSLVASVTFLAKKEGRYALVVVFGTFQENKVPRNGTGQSI